MKLLKSIYKILDNYSNMHKIVSFDELCIIKNINQKTLLKRGITKQSTRRDSFDFPSKQLVTSWFKKTDYSELFNDNGEAILSSQQSTIKYLNMTGCNLADYGFNKINYRMAA